MNYLKREWQLWRNLRIASSALGKYIILYASLLLFSWAGMLFLTDEAGKATPVHILTLICGGRFRTAVVLFIASAMSVGFLRMRAMGHLGLTWMLLPTQLVLLACAIAGIWATYLRHYADGTPRAWEFILTDQLPIILASLLYTAAVLEAGVEE